MSRAIMVSDDTHKMIRTIVMQAMLKDENGKDVTKISDVVRILVSKFIGVRLISDADNDLVAEYGFTDIRQLDLYYETTKRIPREKCTPEVKKELRQAIIDGKPSMDEFIINTLEF